MSGYKKLTINIADEVHAKLAANADERGISLTDLIKRAVALDQFVWEHRDGELLVRDGDDVLHVRQTPRVTVTSFTATVDGTRHDRDGGLITLSLHPDHVVVAPDLVGKKLVVRIVDPAEAEDYPL